MTTPALQPLLAPAVAAVEARSRRSRQLKIGPSDIGACRRRTAYKRHRVRPSNTDNTGMAATLGHWLHKGALEVLRKEYGARIELRVENEHIRGSVDAYHPPLEIARELKGHRANTGYVSEVGTVDDLKTKSTYGMDGVRQYGPRRKELFQTHLYAHLLRTGHVVDKQLSGPLPVDRVRLRYLNRDNGEEYIYEQDYDEQITSDALFWLQQVLDSADPEDLPRDQDGPGLSAECDWCPFLDMCWGPEREDGISRQAVLIQSNEDAEAAMLEYDLARADVKAAEARQKKARRMLDATEPGQYGDLVLKWSESDPEPKPDLERMLDLYREAGLEVPMAYPKPTRTISITRAKEPKKS